MSKYRIKFHVSSGCVGSATEEIVDLIENYGYSEKEAQEIIKDEEKIQELFEEWLWERINTGWKVLEDES